MKFWILLCVVLAAVSCERIRYDGCDVWQLTPKTEKQLLQLRELYALHDNELDRQIIFWEEPRAVNEDVDVLICEMGVLQFRSFLGKTRISSKVTLQNIQRNYDAFWAQHEARKTKAYDPANFNTFEDIMDFLDQLQSNCPAGVTCTVEDIGSSYEGRPLRIFRMMQSDTKPAIWVDSLTHCREWISGTTVLGIMEKMVNEYSSDVNVKRLVDKYNWHFVPVVNPDGYAYTWSNERLWRKTRSPNQGSSCTGTDGNRNYDFMWGTPGSSSNPCSLTYRGSSPASEVETQAMQAAGEALRGKLILYMSYHTYGEYMLFPYGSVDQSSRCMVAPDHADLGRVGNVGARAIESTFGGKTWVSGSTCQALYAASGISPDWAYASGLSKYAYTPELRGPAFDIGPENIAPSIEENWNGLVAMIEEIEKIEGI